MNAGSIGTFGKGPGFIPLLNLNPVALNNKAQRDQALGLNLISKAVQLVQDLESLRSPPSLDKFLGVSIKTESIDILIQEVNAYLKDNELTLSVSNFNLAFEKTQINISA